MFLALSASYDLDGADGYQTGLATIIRFSYYSTNETISLYNVITLY
jgi:hypothetical protein